LGAGHFKVHCTWHTDMPAAPTERKLVEEQNKAYYQNEHNLRFVMMCLFFVYDLRNAGGCEGGP